MTINVRVLVFVVLISSGCADSIWDDLEEHSYANSDVVILTKANFKEQVLENEMPSLVLFYADWCFYCEEFSTIFKQVATDMMEKVLVGAIECSDDNRSIKRKYNVTLFPSMLLINNKLPTPVKGKTAKSIEAKVLELVEGKTVHRIIPKKTKQNATLDTKKTRIKKML
ncbi:unnamed protein product [Diamesa tonsa]